MVINVLQLNNWFGDLRTELSGNEVADTVQGAEELLSQFSQQKDATLDACINTISEGHNLIQHLT